MFELTKEQQEMNDYGCSCFPQSNRCGNIRYVVWKCYYFNDDNGRVCFGSHKRYFNHEKHALDAQRRSFEAMTPTSKEEYTKLKKEYDEKQARILDFCLDT